MDASGPVVVPEISCPLADSKVPPHIHAMSKTGMIGLCLRFVE